MECRGEQGKFFDLMSKPSDLPAHTRHARLARSPPLFLLPLLDFRLLLLLAVATVVLALDRPLVLQPLPH